MKSFSLSCNEGRIKSAFLWDDPPDKETVIKDHSGHDTSIELMNPYTKWTHWLIDHLHKWHLNLNNNTYTCLASHACEKSFV